MTGGWLQIPRRSVAAGKGYTAVNESDESVSFERIWNQFGRLTLTRAPIISSDSSTS